MGNNRLQNAEDNVFGAKEKLKIAQTELGDAIFIESVRVLRKHTFEFSDGTTLDYRNKDKAFIQKNPSGVTIKLTKDSIIDIYGVNPKFRAFLKTY